ncbi:MAG: hypothetical protein ACFCU7_09970 [Pleurocapsa sp.]
MSATKLQILLDSFNYSVDIDTLDNLRLPALVKFQAGRRIFRRLEDLLINASKTYTKSDL